MRLEQNTNAVFVGEPTGGSPNGYGDSRKLTLPSSGLTVRVSTLYWQPSDPRDKRDAIAPDIAAPPARDRDAAMDRVRKIVHALRKDAKLDGEWTGTVRLDFEKVPIRIAGGSFEIPEAKFSCALKECATMRIGDGILFGNVVLAGRDYSFTARSADLRSAVGRPPVGRLMAVDRSPDRDVRRLRTRGPRSVTASLR